MKNQFTLNKGSKIEYESYGRLTNAVILEIKGDKLLILPEYTFDKKVTIKSKNVIRVIS